LIRIDGASYLNGYCSLMVFCMFLLFFYKSEKHVFLCFYLQINVFNIYGLRIMAGILWKAVVKLTTMSVAEGGRGHAPNSKQMELIKLNLVRRVLSS